MKIFIRNYLYQRHDEDYGDSLQKLFVGSLALTNNAFLHRVNLVDDRDGHFEENTRA